jgi:CheY-specific phosphatase CheX
MNIKQCGIAVVVFRCFGSCEGEVRYSSTQSNILNIISNLLMLGSPLHLFE